MCEVLECQEYVTLDIWFLTRVLPLNTPYTLLAYHNQKLVIQVNIVNK